ncbi:1-aminocyclopropane-1-carboxylate oxidase protein [Trifolium repens]|nr:1-aminocyclopropane-1-carboxylate oxidase protein [Trifolium repens]
MMATIKSANSSTYDRKSELKEFDESKTIVSVQGLIENGVIKVPQMFYCGNSNIHDVSFSESNSKLNIPIIDLTGIHDDPVLILRDEGVKKVLNACEKWGFFQVINHEIPIHVLDDEMIKGICRFHQQDAKVRKEYYTRDLTKKVVYLSNFSLYQDQSAEWRDTLAFFWTPHPPKADELPPVCSDIENEYTKEIILIGGLQVLHHNQWIDVPPIHGALVVNIGDLLQLVSNDKFTSVQHRVLAKHVGPRISVASIFRTNNHSHEGMENVIGPINELLSKESQPIYRNTSFKEYMTHPLANGLGVSSLSPFKL